MEDRKEAEVNDDLTEWQTLTAEERRRLILLTVDDLVSGFLYYDRKQDEEGMVRGAVEWSIANGDVSLEDVIIRFGEGVLRAV